MYLEKTAAAISSLQEIHKKNSSPQSPSNSTLSRNSINVFQVPQNQVNFRSMKLHKRNLSVDSRINNKHEFYDSGGLYAQETTKHICRNSYECKQNQLETSRCSGIDQTNSSSSSIENQRLHDYFSDVDKIGRSAQQANVDTMSVSTESPIRRSNSFCNRNIANILPTKTTASKSYKKPINRPISENSSLQKSASSSSFKNICAATPCHQQYKTEQNELFVINGNDNLHTTCDDILFSSDDSHDMNRPRIEKKNHQTDRQKSEPPPISHTRYNKAFLIRMEQNRQTNNDNKGVQACPNTPELSRRANPRSSMPRDSSLSRMKQALPNLQITKKVASKDSSGSSTCSAKQRVLPKYMDISKYKPAQGQRFLKRDESKSTLVSRNEIRKSPSATQIEPSRSSGRIKSAGAKPSKLVITE